MMREPVSVSGVYVPYEVSIEYTARVDAASSVSHLIVAEVLPMFETATEEMTGGVLSARVVKLHVVEAAVPPQKVPRPS